MIHSITVQCDWITTDGEKTEWSELFWLRWESDESQQSEPSHDCSWSTNEGSQCGGLSDCPTVRVGYFVKTTLAGKMRKYFNDHLPDSSKRTTLDWRTDFYIICLEDVLVFWVGNIFIWRNILLSDSVTQTQTDKVTMINAWNNIRIYNNQPTNHCR